MNKNGHYLTFSINYFLNSIGFYEHTLVSYTKFHDPISNFVTAIVHMYDDICTVDDNDGLTECQKSVCRFSDAMKLKNKPTFFVFTKHMLNSYNG